jgi:antitoxin component HigA of HigAB toxin-antitoxin module
MMTEKAQEEYRDALEWLKTFFRSVPEVSLEDREQAKGFIRGFYRAVGMQLKADI